MSREQFVELWEAGNPEHRFVKRNIVIGEIGRAGDKKGNGFGFSDDKVALACALQKDLSALAED